MCIGSHTCIGRSEVNIERVFLLLSTIIETEFLVIEELTNSSIPGQQVPGVLLPFPSQHWDYRHAMLCPTVWLTEYTRNQVLMVTW